MNERVLKCPQCNAPLAPPSRWATTAVCAFCAASVQIDPSFVSSARFKAALAEQEAAAARAGVRSSVIDGGRWLVGEQLARGEHADVYEVARARWPTEHGLLKLLRNPDDQPRFDHEWQVLLSLQRSAVPGASSFSQLVPIPTAHGTVSEGFGAGRRAMVLRRAAGFVDTFEAVRRAYPDGIPPRPSIWIWRRILEVLSFLHRAGLAHGAVVPAHLLVQQHDHGVRLVGYASSGAPGERLRSVVSGQEAFYPDELRRGGALSAAADLQMSARCLAFVLGGEPASGRVPDAVVPPIAALLGEVAIGGWRADAWTLRERVGEVGRAVFGGSAFSPLKMPQ